MRSVSIHGIHGIPGAESDPPSAKGVVQGLSPVRELRAIERLPHSEKGDAAVRCVRDTGSVGKWEKAAVLAWMASRGLLWVGGSPGRRELGRKQLVSPGCRMFLLLSDGQRAAAVGVVGPPTRWVRSWVRSGAQAHPWTQQAYFSRGNRQAPGAGHGACVQGIHLKVGNGDDAKRGPAA